MVHLHYGSKIMIVHFYQEQLDKFKKLGLGAETENGVVITEDLIKTTKRRLEELSLVYPILKHKEKLLDDPTSSNGTIASSRGKDNGNSRHERKKS